ncbi:hypothetical protein NE237_022143 [Protea cynaroides]|uniref:ATP-dependent DNA helicase DDM1 n=1 Tax=Protea cynaroides TaxID=273540 RepID=A0A9Q0HAE0_9MAGN|nr:hypothetical protein NE237_022143 [Protea cynaroides]
MTCNQTQKVNGNNNAARDKEEEILEAYDAMDEEQSLPTSPQYVTREQFDVMLAGASDASMKDYSSVQHPHFVKKWLPSPLNRTQIDKAIQIVMEQFKIPPDVGETLCLLEFKAFAVELFTDAIVSNTSKAIAIREEFSTTGTTKGGEEHRDRVSTVVAFEEVKDESALVLSVEEKMIWWDRFLPHKFVGVWLVENDDSTRHIVYSLPKKCSYKADIYLPSLNAIGASFLLLCSGCSLSDTCASTGRGFARDMEAENDTKNDKAAADSPTSVLGDEEICKEEVKVETEGDGTLTGPENGDSSLISRTMLEEEEKLQEAQVEQEDGERENGNGRETVLDDTQFSKLDELLTQTQLYSEFLLEKMDDITFNGVESQNEENGNGKKRGRGAKRKAATHCNTRKAKKAVAAMIMRSQEGTAPEDVNLTEEEKAEKEQAELVPLLTGGKLKPYQIKGVKWLISLWQNGLNGILADQMGLGKTIQTIAFLAHLKEKGLDGPYLVIAPLSTLSNWVNEISRFTPSINAIIYHGDRKERQEIRKKYMTKAVGPKFPIVVTSYQVALNEARKVLRHYNWKYLVVDEGHRLKNSECKLLKELNLLPVENKLLLTGTPLQNNLTELWSLLHFILPDIFSSLKEFESWFDLSGKCYSDAQKDEFEEKRRVQVISKLHAILRPFLLRRMKSDVEKMLPQKKEIILYANMTEHQMNIQDHLINKTFENHLQEKFNYGHGMKGKLHNLMVQLRKNCNHPDLLESAFDGSNTYPPVEQLVEQCGKFCLLDRLLSQLFARKHKVLIFSQWTKVLDIMDYYFSEKGFEVCRIDGSVKLEERKRQIQEFNDINSNRRIFLLSTRAGGLGINLTAADTCILYDSDWNPQMDLQAMDRCHRIGQTKPVHVYRLATAQSVEGRILKRAFSKLKLEHVVIGKGQFQQERNKTNTLEEEDLLSLLRDEEDAEDKLIQTDISDEELHKVLDRSDLIVNSSSDGKIEVPLKGPGWEVVIPTKSGGMLSALNS